MWLFSAARGCRRRLVVDAVTVGRSATYYVSPPGEGDVSRKYATNVAYSLVKGAFSENIQKNVTHSLVKGAFSENIQQM